jgi:hypothetical protein
LRSTVHKVWSRCTTTASEVDENNKLKISISGVSKVGDVLRHGTYFVKHAYFWTSRLYLFLGSKYDVPEAGHA